MQISILSLNVDADLWVEFKETHLGPLKNSLGNRSTSTSTIKAETPEPMDEKLSTISSNGIGERLCSNDSILTLMTSSCVGSFSFSASRSIEARDPRRDSP